MASEREPTRAVAAAAVSALLLAGVGLTACGARPAGAGKTDGSGVPAPSVPSTPSVPGGTSPGVVALASGRSSNAALAQKRARYLRGWVGQPPGCSPVAAVPTGSSSSLSSPSVRPGSPYVADVHRFCVISWAPSAVIAWYKAHEPAGTSMSGDGTSSSRTGVTVQFLGFTLPPSTVFTEQGAEVSVASSPGGRAALRIDGMVLYVPNRPASERVPAHVRYVAVSVTPETGPQVTRTVSSAARISQLVSIVDGLQRPSYTVNPGGPMITLAMEREDVVLRFFGERGALLASVNDHPLLGAGTGNTRMWVGGREGPILLDLGGLARAAAQVTGVRLG